MTQILDKLPEKSSLFETVIVSINDKLVKLFLNDRIKFTDISKKMNSMLELKEFKKYKNFNVNKIDDIMNLDKRIKIKLEDIASK